jgi:predicted enzyme related to lactoylglutathione lyase
VTTFAHRRVLIYVQDLPSAIAFYRDVLGLTPGASLESRNQEFPVDGGPPLVLHIGGVAVDEPRGLVGSVPGLQVDDLPAIVGRLQSRGVRTIQPIFEIPQGWVYSFADPEGNTIQLFQARPEESA